VQVKLWGCRGSVPTPGPDTVTYGGNTSCVEVSLDGETALVLDAGTGIRRLGLELVDRGTRRIHLCLTHLHLDHLEGLRFFAPLWDRRVELDIWGPASHLLSLRERIARSFSPPLFPLDLREVPATITFHSVGRTPWTIGRISVAADFVLHPGTTVGYRIEANESSLAYLPDHEPALAGAIAAKPNDWISGASLASGVDALIHDAQYFEDEYEEHIGWGHSSVADAVTFTQAVGASRLLLFHHEPQHSDRSLERLEDRARELAGGSGGQPPALAHEGMVLELS
jgi:phosphoribosyl 1,2-cyclic phosphodiesterase